MEFLSWLRSISTSLLKPTEIHLETPSFNLAVDETIVLGWKSLPSLVYKRLGHDPSG